MEISTEDLNNWTKEKTITFESCYDSSPGKLQIKGRDLEEGIFSCVTYITAVCKDKFRIEPRYAHKKNLNKSGGKNLILETDHPRSLKFDTFLFFEAF